MNNNYWYAVMVDADDGWDYGSHDLKDARRMMMELNESLEINGLEREAFIAVIDESGSDAFCVSEIREE